MVTKPVVKVRRSSPELSSAHRSSAPLTGAQLRHLVAELRHLWFERHWVNDDYELVLRETLVYLVEIG